MMGCSQEVLTSNIGGINIGGSNIDAINIDAMVSRYHDQPHHTYGSDTASTTLVSRYPHEKEKTSAYIKPVTKMPVRIDFCRWFARNRQSIGIGFHSCQNPVISHEKDIAHQH